MYLLIYRNRKFRELKHSILHHQILYLQISLSGLNWMARTHHILSSTKSDIYYRNLILLKVLELGLDSVQFLWPKIRWVRNIKTFWRAKVKKKKKKKKSIFNWRLNLMKSGFTEEKFNWFFSILTFCNAEIPIQQKGSQ